MQYQIDKNVNNTQYIKSPLVHSLWLVKHNNSIFNNFWDGLKKMFACNNTLEISSRKRANVFIKFHRKKHRGNKRSIVTSDLSRDDQLPPRSKAARHSGAWETAVPGFTFSPRVPFVPEIQQKPAALIRAAELIKAHLKSVDRDKTAINLKLVRPWI